MRSFALCLGIITFAVACSDASGPDQHASLTPRKPSDVRSSTGNIPPPPVDAAMNVTVGGVGTAAFNGTYLAGTGTTATGLSALAVSTQSSTSGGGNSWLNFDSKQPDGFGVTNTPNTRFQSTDNKLSGKGTLVFFGQFNVVIDQVLSFVANPDYGSPGVPCATITFTATVNGDPGHLGQVNAFDRDFCELYSSDKESYDSQGSFYSCDDEDW
jgi:hypothetical protein